MTRRAKHFKKKASHKRKPPNRSLRSKIDRAYQRFQTRLHNTDEQATISEMIDENVHLDTITPTQQSVGADIHSDEHTDEYTDEHDEKHTLESKDIAPETTETTAFNDHPVLAQVESGALFSSNKLSHDDHTYQQLILGLLDDISMRELMLLSTHAFHKLDHNDAITHALLFIYQILIVDEKNELIHYAGQENELTQVILNIVEEFQANHAEGCELIMASIQHKKNQAAEHYNGLIAQLTLNTELPLTLEALSRMIYSLIAQYRQPNAYEQDILIQQLYDWLSHLDPSYLQSEQNDLSNPYHAVLHFLQILHEDSINVSNLLNLLQEKKEAIGHFVPNHDIVNLAPLSDFNIFWKNIHAITSNTISPTDKHTFAQELIHGIYSFYQDCMQTMPIIECHFATQHIDSKLIEDGLYATPLAKHANHMAHFARKCALFWSALLIYQVENNQLSTRHKVVEIHRLVDFYYLMLKTALRDKKFIVFLDLYHALTEYVPSSFVSTDRLQKKYNPLIENQYQKLNLLIQNNQSLPLINNLTQQHDFLTNQYYTHKHSLEHALAIGGLYHPILAYKNSTSHSESPVPSNLESLMDSFLYSCFAEACYVSPLTLCVDIDTNNAHKKLIHIAHDILPPNKPDPYRLSSFASIKALNKVLRDCLYRHWGYHLDIEQSQIHEAIIEFVQGAIGNTLMKDHQIVPFSDIEQLINLLDELDKEASMPLLDKPLFYTMIFEHYFNLLKQPPNSLKLKQLLAFQNSLDDSSVFNDIVETLPSWYDFFSQNRKCYQATIALEDRVHDLIENSSVEIEPMKPSAFIDLLYTVLEGKAPGIFSQDQAQHTSNFGMMMNQREYWITEWDPEYVGASQIFLSLSEEKQSALSRFSAHSLRQQFLAAFNWAIDNNKVQTLSRITSEHENNLIVSSRNLSNDLQLKIIKFLLLSFDILGKLAGRDGALVLKNYESIDALVTNIEKCQSYLNREYCLTKEFSRQLDNEIQTMYDQNQQINQLTEQNQGFFDKNEELNDFCHINEVVAHKLLGIPFKQSILSPSQPTYTIQEQLKNVLQLAE